MHISCPIYPIDTSQKQKRRHYIGITARKLLVTSYLISLIHQIIGNNCVGLDARPSIGPQPGLSLVGSNREERWMADNHLRDGSTQLGDGYQPSAVTAVVGNRLQNYQFQLKQPQAVGPIPGGAQQRPPPPIRQPASTSTLPPAPPPPPPTQTPQPSAAPSQQRATFIGLIRNGSTTTARLAPLLVAGPALNSLIDHLPQVQQQLRQPTNYDQTKQQVFATTTNKQVVQSNQKQQIPQFVYATKQATSLTPFPKPVATTTTTQPDYKNSDITPTAGALFSCLGCDPIDRWPLFKSLVSLQNPLLLGGDILVRTSKRRPIATGIGRLYKSSRSALVDPVSLWPNAIIYYELDESVTHLASLIWRVMQQFHVHTCIRFVERRNNEPDFVRIGAHRGCSSYIGRIGGEQLLSLGDGCEFSGTIAHELLHAVGFYHHQNRSDRDDFLEILWENVAKGKEDQFRKMSAEENYLLNEFDYNSIMLYGPHTFGKTLDKITMRPKRGGVILLELIEKRGLSALDIDSVNKLYKCDGSGVSYNLALEQPAAAAAAAAAASSR